MSKFKTAVLSAIVLAIGVGLILEHRAGTKRSNEILSLKLEVQQLAEQIASLQQDHKQALDSGVQTTTDAGLPDGQLAAVMRVRGEVGQLRESLAELERAVAAISNQLASATGANAPFVYPDSIKKKDYAFSGYAAPQSALQSMWWALSRSDARAFQASLTSTMAAAFADQTKDLPEGVMPGGWRGGALYKASGYRVLEETPVSNAETRFKVFLEGQHLTLKLIFKKIGDEWKWADN